MCYLGLTEPDCGYPILWFLMAQRSQEDRNTERSTLVTNSRVMTSLPVSEPCKHGHLATQHFPRHSSYSITNTNNNNIMYFSKTAGFWMFSPQRKITHRSKTTAYKERSKPSALQEARAIYIIPSRVRPQAPTGITGCVPMRTRDAPEIHQRQILNQRSIQSFSPPT